MYSSIKHKKKICKTCNKPKYIFSHGECLNCSRKHFKPIRRTKLKARSTNTTEAKMNLRQSKAFYKAFKYWKGKNFLTDKNMCLEELKAHNFIHVLSKKMYPYFKYYYKNIVIGNLIHHKLIDQGTALEIADRMKNYPNEKWISYYALEARLKEEYREWVKTNKGEYKLN